MEPSAETDPTPQRRRTEEELKAEEFLLGSHGLLRDYVSKPEVSPAAAVSTLWRGHSRAALLAHPFRVGVDCRRELSARVIDQFVRLRTLLGPEWADNAYIALPPGRIRVLSPDNPDRTCVVQHDNIRIRGATDTNGEPLSYLAGYLIVEPTAFLHELVPHRNAYGAMQRTPYVRGFELSNVLLAPSNRRHSLRLSLCENFLLSNIRIKKMRGRFQYRMIYFNGRCFGTLRDCRLCVNDGQGVYGVDFGPQLATAIHVAGACQVRMENVEVSGFHLGLFVQITHLIAPPTTDEARADGIVGQYTAEFDGRVYAPLGVDMWQQDGYGFHDNHMGIYVGERASARLHRPNSEPANYFYRNNTLWGLDHWENDIPGFNFKYTPSSDSTMYWVEANGDKTLVVESASAGGAAAVLDEDDYFSRFGELRF